ncbi:Na+/phosphate symporter [Opitutaceae bacterium TAV1]|nr:Na+/phosphate symporter [Opitutaceae bacterium TAV1]
MPSRRTALPLFAQDWKEKREESRRMNSTVAILGGVGLILFGIRFLRKGLDRLFGGRLIGWLSGLAARPWKAFGAGAAAGAVSPSSTTISIMAIQLLGDGRLRAEGVLAMLLGANVGMTVLAQLMAVRVQDFAGVLVAIGVAGFIYTRRESLRGAGQCLLALGFIFMAMAMIGDGAAGVAGSDDARQAFVLLHGHPALIFAGTAALAVGLQSSTATVGLGIGLCSSGLLGSGELIPWVLGTNAGVGVSSLVVGWRTTEARRLGVANLLTKLTLALPLLWLPGISTRLFAAMRGDLAHQVVMFHTGFNAAVGVLMLPLLGTVMRLSRLIVPEPSTDLGEGSGEVSHLDPKALDTPSVALARATRETLRMADRVRAQLTGFWRACRTGDTALARRIQKEDDKVDWYNRELIEYLSHIGGEKSARDTRWQVALMNFAVEMEAVGDLLDKHLCDLAIKQRVEGAILTPAEWHDLEEVYDRLLARFDGAVSLLGPEGNERAQVFVTGKRSFNEHCRELQQGYFTRLRAADAVATEAGTAITSSYFIDYLNGFRRINSHLTGVAYALAAPGEK